MSSPWLLLLSRLLSRRRRRLPGRSSLLVVLRGETLLAVGLLGVIGAGLLQARGLLLLHGHRLLGRRLLVRALVIGLLLRARGWCRRCRRRGLRERVAG